MGTPLEKLFFFYKYRVGNFGWDVNPAPRRASGMWHAIAACVDKFKEGTRFKLGRGDRIRFWTDLWCGDSSLDSQFPSIYHLSLNPLGAISHFYSLTGNQAVWDITLCRNLSDTETDSFSELLQAITSYRINTNVEDRITFFGDRKI